MDEKPGTLATIHAADYFRLYGKVAGIDRAP